MKKFEEKYKILNREQKEAVDRIEGPVCVVAGPGTGKTQILTLRIANILKQQGGDLAKNILALTFTNSGVSAMRERLVEFVGTETAYQVGIFTFHSFADEQIRNNPEIFKRFAFSRPITEIEKIQIIEDILKKGKWKYLQTFVSDFHYTRGVISAIDDLKSDAITPNDLEASILNLEKRILEKEGENAFYKRKCAGGEKGDIKKTIVDKIEKQKKKQTELVKIYQAYQDELVKKKLYDFSDMVLSVVQEANENKEFKAILQEKYLYILVDEHQDTNNAQNKLVEIIADAKVNEGRPNIFTVGDEKQAIYRFQGASLENFLKFKDQYQDVQVINLKNNYRSTQNILDSAHDLIASKEKLEAKNEKYQNNEKITDQVYNSVRVSEFGDYKEELIFIAEDIQQKIKAGKDVNEIAIFYKENKNLLEIKNILEKFGIPYQVKSKENILDSREIKKLILLLRAVENPFDNENLAKVLLIDFLDFDIQEVLLILEKMANRRGKQIKNKSIFKLLAVSDLENFGEFTEFLKEQKKLSKNLDFLEFFEQFIHQSGFLEYILKLKNNAAALQRLEKIFDEAKKQFVIKKDYGLFDFLDYIDILEKYDISIDLGVNNLMEGVSLMTAHGSKGLEFADVYITNFIDSLWGGKRKRGQSFILPTSKIAGDIEDERRLFYVALTRGKEKVQITYSKTDLDGREKIPSRFLEEIKNLKIETVSIKNKVEKYFGQKEKKVLSIFDKKYIQKLFLKNTLSVSALNNYAQSPIKYFFRNLIRLPSTQNKTMLFGSVVHDALDTFFKKKENSEEALLKDFTESLEKFKIPEKYYEDIRLHGEEVLQNYYQEYQDDLNFEVQTEKRMFAEMKLDSGETLKLYGIIDKMEMLAGGKIRVVDYKTGKTYSEKTKDQKADLDRQLTFYKLLADKFYDDNRVEEGVLDFVEKSKKTGKFEKQTRKITNEEVKELKSEIQKFANDILSGEFLEKKYERTKENAEYFDLWELLKKN